MAQAGHLIVNGVDHQYADPPETLLVDYLRTRLRLIGAHVGCESSTCGACTVMVDGLPVKSCTMLAVQAVGSEVTTVEGLSTEGLHPLAAAFLAERGFQCGYCTPGMMMAAAALLVRTPDPSQHEIRRALDGNLCRCTGYDTIVRSVITAAAMLRGEDPPQPDRPTPIPGGGHLSRGL